MYRVAYEDSDLVIRIEKDSINKHLLSNLLEYLESEQIRQKSKMSRRQAKIIAKEINKNVWRPIKDKVLGQ